MSDSNALRLNKAISDTGACSRREADTYIEQGRVFVNGRRASVGDKVNFKDEIRLDGRVVKETEKTIFLAFNKPVGITCTTEKSVKGNIIDYLKYPKRIYPIGRLDKDSEGLIFLTNTGDLVNKILRAGNQHEKEYLVTVNKPITPDFLEKMANGVPVLGETTKRCEVTRESEFVFKIILVQGLNRQIRRMCEYFNYDVLKLKRIRIMNISLDKLQEGDWRDVDENELAFIYKAIKASKDELVKKSKSADSKSTKSSEKPARTRAKSSDSKPERTSEKPARAGSKSSDSNPERTSAKPTRAGSKLSDSKPSRTRVKASDSNPERTSAKSSDSKPTRTGAKSAYSKPDRTSTKPSRTGAKSSDSKSDRSSTKPVTSKPTRSSAKPSVAKENTKPARKKSSDPNAPNTKRNFKLGKGGTSKTGSSRKSNKGNRGSR